MRGLSALLPLMAVAMMGGDEGGGPRLRMPRPKAAGKKERYHRAGSSPRAVHRLKAKAQAKRERRAARNRRLSK